MAKYQDLAQSLRERGLRSNLKPLTPDRLTQIRQAYPGLPDDYADFLLEIGAGNLGEGGYMIYDGLLCPDEVYDSVSAENMHGLLLFGDDFQGQCAGFDPKEKWAVVEIDPTNMSSAKVATSFDQFIRGRIAQLV